MVWVTLGLGSNIDAENNISSCLDALLLNFQDLSLSCVFESEAVGFSGDNFLNMTVGINTELGVQDLSLLLKKIEDKHGRERNESKYCGKTLDIDLLTYGKKVGKVSGIELPREEIIENAFVLWPLSQISAKERHPVSKKSYKELWQQFDKTSQKLWPVNFNWHGRDISRKA